VNNFKFGVINQKLHQTSKEALFGNINHSPAMDKFLDMIGRRVALSEHSGYRGGLDTQFGQTGQHSVYTEHMGKEVMYHVATLLPFSLGLPGGWGLRSNLFFLCLPAGWGLPGGWGLRSTFSSWVFLPAGVFLMAGVLGLAW
jgi:hypothetical protein